MLDFLPGQLGDMDQTVEATDIDKGSEIGHLTDCSFAEFSDLQICKSLLFLLLLFSFQDRSVGQDEISTTWVDFSHNAKEFLSYVVRSRFNSVFRELADRDESSDVSNLAFDTTGIGALDLCLNNRTFFEIGPVVGADGFAGKAKFIEPFFGVERPDDNIEQQTFAGHI